MISVALSPSHFARELHRFLLVPLSSLGATLLQDSAVFLHLIALNFSMHEDTITSMTSHCISPMSSLFAMASLIACKYVQRSVAWCVLRIKELDSGGTLF